MELEAKRRKVVLLTEKLRRQSEVDLGAFIPYVKPKWKRPNHLQPLLNFFNDVREGKQRNLALTVPPRHGKTETTLFGIAYLLRDNPELTLSYISYSQTQSESKAVKAHAIINQLGLEVNPNIANRKEYRLIEGGGLLTTARGGALTGQGVNLLIIDDPFSNHEEANSLLIRNKVWDWYESVAETRLEPGGSQLIIHTRWHEDDLIGRLMKHRPEFEFVRLPALEDGLNFDGKERVATEREIGQPLWGFRFDEGNLLDKQKKSPYTFSALYQGLPRPREDYLFKDYATYSELPKEGLSYTICTDLAYTEKTLADHSAVVVMARKEDVCYIVEVYRYQKGIDYSIQLLKRLYEKYSVRVGVEANGAQKAVYDMVRKEVPATKLMPNGDKYTRALSYAEAWNNGKVLLPIEASWKKSFVEEHQNFTGIGDKEDDQVDAGAYSFNRLKKSGIFVVV